MSSIPPVIGDFEFSLFSLFSKKNFFKSDDEEEAKNKKAQAEKEKKAKENLPEKNGVNSIEKSETKKNTDQTPTPPDAKANTENKNEKKNSNIINNNNTPEGDPKQILLTKLCKRIKLFLFRKKVKELIKIRKETFPIVCTVNNVALSLHIILDEETIKKYKLVNEPILNQNIAYVPRKILKKKNLLKFTFINSKNEVVIDPKYNTEYVDDNFINVLNLKKLKDKEEENQENFQNFLESYYNDKFSNKNIANINIEKKYSSDGIRGIRKHKTMDNRGVKRNTKRSKTEKCLASILKERPKERVVSNKKISFGDVKFAY